MQFPDSDGGSSCLSRRNMSLGGASIVAAISLPKNSLGADTALNDRAGFEQQRWKR
jgi:hypothetical protein